MTRPCPRCGTQHDHGPYVQRPELKKESQKGMPVAPPDVDCSCGAKLRMSVPIFAVDPEGWHWRIL